MSQEPQKCKPQRIARRIPHQVSNYSKRRGGSTNLARRPRSCTWRLKFRVCVLAESPRISKLVKPHCLTDSHLSKTIIPPGELLFMHVEAHNVSSQAKNISGLRSCSAPWESTVSHSLGLGPASTDFVLVTLRY